MNDRQQIAVITGAGQGLGRTLALICARGGVIPVLVGRTASKLESVAAEVNTMGGDSVVYTADVTESEQVAHLAERLTERFDHVDMLMNCAGQALIRTLDETDETDWGRIMDVNLKAPYLMCRAMLPLIRRSANGSIVNVASKVATGSYPGVTAYTAAKAGLVGFTHSLAAELKEAEIRVVAVCPGAMDTPMRWAATPDYERKLVIPPETVAAAIWHVVTLPRGATSGDIVLTSMHYG